MSRKQKLELTWIGKENRLRPEPRVLIQRREYQPKTEVEAGSTSSGMIIHGDNLLALKALQNDLSGAVKCIYIDPPFNTGSAFEHYDDGVEHSIWLSMMRERLEILWSFLRPDGSIWITIDDHEGHYLKVMCDEVFGRRSFVSTIIWENFYGRSNAAAISPSHNYILVYSPMGSDWKNVRRLIPRDEKSASKYSNPDGDPLGAWRLGPIFAPEERHEGLMYPVRTPSGRVIRPPKGSHWRMLEPEFWQMVDQGRIIFGPRGDNNPAVKLYLNEVQAGLVPRTLWPHTEVGHSQEAKREIQALFPDETPFDTPKPERLLRRIIEISTNAGDLVLDSFAGSGTTGAVAHKLGRRWVMIELGQHAISYICPRLEKVIDGSDLGGITESSGWTGGGRYSFWNLAPSLLERDRWGNWVVSKDYNPSMLAEAMCKHMGYTFSPSQNPLEYWNHGCSSECDFIYVTTQALTHSMLKALSNDLGPDCHLLICCKAFSGKANEFANLTVRRIPQAVLANCEWGRDDYSLRIASPPKGDGSPDDPTRPDLVPPPTKGRRKTVSTAPDLFDPTAGPEA